MKNCTKCSENKPLEAFSLDRSTKDGLSKWCKGCRSLAAKARYSLNKTTELSKKSKYYEENKEKISLRNKSKRSIEPLSDKLKRRDYSLRRYFGISLKQYDELREKQNHVCPICLEALERENYSYPVDHAHKGDHAGKIRAILHDKCNRFVMWRHDNPEQLRRAADLMENPLTDWVVPEEFTKGRKKRRRKKKY